MDAPKPWAASFLVDMEQNSEHHREKISGSPALSLLLKANTKKIELLQSAKVLALNIQKHLKLSLLRRCQDWQLGTPKVL